MSVDNHTTQHPETDTPQTRQERIKADNATRAKRYRERKKHRELEAIARKQARQGPPPAPDIHDAPDALETLDVQSTSGAANVTSATSTPGSKRGGGKRKNKRDNKRNSERDAERDVQRDDNSSQNARYVTNVTTVTESVTESVTASSKSRGKSSDSSNAVKQSDGKQGKQESEPPARDVREPDPERVEEIKRRIDGSLARTRLTPEFKEALQDAYVNDLGVDFRALAKATGVSMGSLVAAVQEAPQRAERARQNRQAMIVEDLEAGLAILAKRFREQAENGQLDPTTKNMRDFSIMYGVITDKRQLLAGRATRNIEVRGHLTIEERKERMREVLDRAKVVAARLESGSKS